MSHSNPARNVTKSLLHEAGCLLSPAPTLPLRRLTDEYEVDELLLAAAQLVRGQAEVAHRYTLTREDRRTVVEAAVAAALGTGLADLASIGAIGVLVDVTGGSDEIVIGSALARIMATFDDDELVQAAIALIAGWMTAVARLVGLPAAHVLRILVALDGDVTDIDGRRTEPDAPLPPHGDRSARGYPTCRARTAGHRTDSTTTTSLGGPLRRVPKRVIKRLPQLPRRVAAD